MNRFFTRVFNAVDGVFARAAAVRNEYASVEEGFDAVQAEIDAIRPPYLPTSLGDPFDVLRVNQAGTAAEFAHPGEMRVVNVTGSRDIAASDFGAILLCNSASPIVLTVKLNAAVAVGLHRQLVIARLGTGAVSVSADPGVAVRSSGSLFSCRAQYSQITLLKIGTDEHLLGGDRG